MRIGDLEALHAAVETGSLSAAARRLGASQPAISRRLQRLEAELGTQLLDRSALGVEPTAAGARAAQCAEDVLAAVARLQSAVSAERAPLGGTVRVVASTTPGDHLVPALVATFVDEHPGVRVDVLAADSAQVPAAVLERRADVGFTGRHDGDPRLTHIAVAVDEVVLAVPAGHPLATAGTVAVSALASERMVWREHGSGTQQSFLEVLSAAGHALEHAAPAMTVGSSQAVVSAVRAGCGIGVVSRRAVEAANGVVALRIDRTPVLRHLWMVHVTGGGRTTAVSAFLAHAAAAHMDL